jgi:hypothetical protein
LSKILQNGFPVALLLSLPLLMGCQSLYYNSMEKVGVHKRDIMVSRVEKARDSQGEAQEQFQSALEQFSALIEYDGGNLERVYNKLNNEYEDCVSAAQDVSDRIDAVEDVSHALFAEWKNEIGEYSNSRLKAASQKQLHDTQQRYSVMLKSLRSAEATMDPILSSLKDNVLYLKHNLNAQAIGALRGELDGIERDIDRLIIEMNASIKESDAFIASMR